jgi:hypothetical protein
MTMTVEKNELIASTLPPAAKPLRDGGSRRKAPADPALRLARAKITIEKLEEQNNKAATVLQALSALWLSADAKRRQGEAEIALNHFNDALAALRKSLAAT